MESVGIPIKFYTSSIKHILSLIHHQSPQKQSKEEL